MKIIVRKLISLFERMPIIIASIIFASINMIDGLLLTEEKLAFSKISQLFTINGLITICIIEASSVLVQYLSTMVDKVLDIKIQNDRYRYYQDKVFNSKMSDIQKASTGKIFDSVSTISKNYGHLVIMMLSIATYAIPFIVMVYKVAKISILSAILNVISIVLATIAILMFDKIGKFSDRLAEARSRLSGVEADNLMNIKTLKYMGRKEYADKRLTNSQHNHFSLYINPIRHTPNRLADVIIYATIIVNIYVNRNDLETLAFMVLTSNSIFMMTNYLINISDILIETKGYRVVVKNLKGDDIHDRMDMPDVYNLTNVEFDYGKDSTHFTIDNLSFIKNNRYHVVGESGEGKSTLANLIVGAIEPTIGDVNPVKSFYVYQETECMNDTLRNNITFYNDKITDDMILSLFNELAMTSWFDELPNGLDTIIGEKGCKLSSGQKQRVNIIRSIFRMRERNAEFIILDEITSNLDAKTEKLAIDLIDRECKGTLMIISHHGDFSSICDHTIRVVNHEFIQFDSKKRVRVT